VPRSPKRPLDKHIIDQWPEVFSDIDLTAIPVYYIHSVVITFKDGRKWNVVINPEDRNSEENHIPKNLSELFENYSEQIENVDFRLDVERIKKDVMKTTKRFLKRKK
jgi:hypothetical protein